MSGCRGGPLYNRAVTPLSRTAFLTLLLIACMMGANHVGARLAFDHGLDVPTAVLCRSGVTALALVLLLRLQRVAWSVTPQQRRMLPRIGVLIAIQSLCIYAAVARMPVADSSVRPKLSRRVDTTDEIRPLPRPLTLFS